MRFILCALFIVSFFACEKAKPISGTDWYSATNTNGIIIQNSFPRGGPLKGLEKRGFNFSHLVFFTRMANETESPQELTVYFSADSIPIPHSPDTFVRLFLPSDTMTYGKRSVYDFGVKNFEGFGKPTSFRRLLKPGEECRFNVVGIFYQTLPTAEFRDRGGNRAEFVLKGHDLFYRMPPQIEWLPCGKIISSR